jgi:hypothetical protein
MSKSGAAVKFHRHLLRRALSAVRGCYAIASFHSQPRAVETLKEWMSLLSFQQDEQDEDEQGKQDEQGEDVGKEVIIRLHNSWIAVYAVLVSCVAYVFIPM